jgi:hypothetical protein
MPPRPTPASPAVNRAGRYLAGNNSTLNSHSRKCWIGAMIDRAEHAEQNAGADAHHAEHRAGHHEDAHHARARRADGAQDGDIPRLVLHQHQDAGDDVERRDHHNNEQDQAHHIALDHQRRHIGRAALDPALHPVGFSPCSSRPNELVRRIRVGQAQADNRVALIVAEEVLRGLDRQESNISRS